METILAIARVFGYKPTTFNLKGHYMKTRSKEAAGRIIIFGRMIKFSHTVFALPFALAAVVLAHRSAPVTLELIFWILAAMIGARSASMGFNRIVDARIDKLNPRTAGREIPAGTISSGSAIFFVICFSLVFIFAAGMISKLCLILSFPVLAILFFYSYTKRFTALSHLYLGLSISLAPLGAWIAVTGEFALRPLVLCMALFTYIAGFDILYACQDTEFDKNTGLHSIPAKFGNKTAFHISAGLHVVSFVSFCSIMAVFDLGVIYLIALLIIGALLVTEHKLVRPGDMARIDLAFFHVNSAISVVLFLGVLGDALAKSLL